MFRRALVLTAALAVVAVVAGVPGAAGAAVWSAPANVSQAANDLATTDIGIDAHGRALAAWPFWNWQSGTPHGHYVLGGWRTATRAPGAGGFGAPRVAPVFASGPVLYGVSRAVGLDQRSLGWNRCGERTTLRARFGTSSGTFDGPRTIVTSRGPGGDGRPVVAASGTGVVLAAWGAVPGSDCQRSIVQASIRRPGGSGFGAPFTLRGSGRPEAPSVAVGAGGDLLVAWSRRVGNGETRIEARVRPAGHGWGPVATLGTGSVAGPVVTAVAQNGRAYVAWAAQNISESTGLAARVSVAVRPAGAGSFRTATTLERIATRTVFLPRFAPVLALAGTRALIAWTGHDTAWRVRVARSGANGTFGAPQTVSAAGADALLGDLAALPDGTAAVTWSGLDGEQLVKDVWAAVRPAGGAFGAPELVSDGALRLPSVALDPVTGQPTVLWSQRLGPQASVATITAYVRAATRIG